jgi:16S rRNA C967 or C1407 C5-methylase (RsmB/RsmF family)/NOL1/NOP2/fmu family ribosome biogenesis protein
MRPQIPTDFLKSVSLIDERKKALLVALEENPVISIRKHPLKNDELESTDVPWCPLGQYLSIRPAFIEDPHFHAGKYYSQEASSMAIWKVLSALNLPTEPKVLDFCAAPGGKSTLLQDYFSGKGVIVSNEIHQKRNNILQENLIKWGYSNKIVTQMDAEQYAEVGALFDLVLVDAPCSGEGMFRKEMVAREEWSEANVQNCVIRQIDIVQNIAKNVVEGGYLIYSTCTFNPQENENIAHFLIQELGFESVKINGEDFTGWQPLEDNDVFGWRAFPGEVEGEGLSLFVFKKKVGSITSVGKKKTKRKNIELPKEVEVTQELLAFDIGGQISVMNDTTYSLLTILKKKNCYIKLAGVKIGEEIKGKLIPQHEAVMACDVKLDYPTIELTKSEAIQFLRGETFTLALNQKGWVIATFEGSRLGLLKSMGNRWNNYFPKYYRIRKEINL